MAFARFEDHIKQVVFNQDHEVPDPRFVLKKLWVLYQETEEYKLSLPKNGAFIQSLMTPSRKIIHHLLLAMDRPMENAAMTPALFLTGNNRLNKHEPSEFIQMLNVYFSYYPEYLFLTDIFPAIHAKITNELHWIHETLSLKLTSLIPKLDVTLQSVVDKDTAKAFLILFYQAVKFSQILQVPISDEILDSLLDNLKKSDKSKRDMIVFSRLRGNLDFSLNLKMIAKEKHLHVYSEIVFTQYDFLYPPKGFFKLLSLEAQINYIMGFIEYISIAPYYEFNTLVTLANMIFDEGTKVQQDMIKNAMLNLLHDFFNKIDIFDAKGDYRWCDEKKFTELLNHALHIQSALNPLEKKRLEDIILKAIHCAKEPADYLCFAKSLNIDLKRYKEPIIKYLQRYKADRAHHDEIGEEYSNSLVSRQVFMIIGNLTELFEYLSMDERNLYILFNDAHYTIFNIVSYAQQEMILQKLFADLDNIDADPVSEVCSNLEGEQVYNLFWNCMLIHNRSSTSQKQRIEEYLFDRASNPNEPMVANAMLAKVNPDLAMTISQISNNKFELRMRTGFVINILWELMTTALFSSLSLSTQQRFVLDLISTDHPLKWAMLLCVFPMLNAGHHRLVYFKVLSDVQINSDIEELPHFIEFFTLPERIGLLRVLLQNTSMSYLDSIEALDAYIHFSEVKACLPETDMPDCLIDLVGGYITPQSRRSYTSV